MCRVCLLLLLTLLSAPGSAGPLAPVVLRVELLEGRPTDYSSDCIDAPPSEGPCIEWSNWSVYDARVKQVIEGHYAGDTVSFGIYMHGLYALSGANDAFVFLEPFANAESAQLLGTPWRAEELLFPGEVLCIPQEHFEALTHEVFRDETPMQSPGMTCVSTWRFDDGDPLGSCADIEEEEARSPCEKRALEGARQQLESLEATLALRILQSGGRSAAAQDKRDALRAFRRSNRDFRHSVRSTCEVEIRITAIGGELEAGEIGAMRLGCEYSLLQSRVRLLRRDQSPRE